MFIIVYHSLPQWDLAFWWILWLLRYPLGSIKAPDGFHLKGIDDAKEQFQCIEGFLPGSRWRPFLYDVTMFDWSVVYCRINEGEIFSCLDMICEDMMGQLPSMNCHGGKNIYIFARWSMAYTQVTPTNCLKRPQGSSQYLWICIPLSNF